MIRSREEADLLIASGTAAVWGLKPPLPRFNRHSGHKVYFNALRCVVQRARLLLGKGGTLKHERDKPYAVLGKRKVVRDERPLVLKGFHL